MSQSFLVHAPDDAVGVAVRDITAGPGVAGRVRSDDGAGTEISLDVVEDVPLGHKVALRAIGDGERVVEYGLPIGRATQDIAPGAHVHVHNVKGERWA